MQTRIVAYDALGARRGVLPNPLEIMVTTGHNDLGVVSVHYDRTSPKHEYLDNEPEIALETLINDAWVEIRNTRAKCLTVDFDHLEEVPTRRYDFLGVGESLRGVLVYGSYGMALNDDGKVQFTTSNVGRIISTIWDNAEGRGWSGFDYSFTPTHDSAGQPWNKTFSISYAFETSLLNILGQLVSQGTCDYEWEGRTLHLYNAETYLARDLSLGANPVRFAGTGSHDGVDSAPEMTDVGQLATHVVVMGEEGLRWEFATGTVVPEGRREVILTFSGVDDIGTAEILAAPTILKSQNHLKNTTRQFHLTDDTKNIPYIDYQPGDWAYIQRGLEFEKMRIFSMNLQINANGTQGYVTLGDRIDDLLERMYARIQGLTGGVLNEGAGPVKMPPKRIPTAPYGVDVTTGAFISETGQTQGIVGVNFSHDGKDTHGENIDIRDYRIYYRVVGAEHWLHMADSNDQSESFSPLQVYDELRNKLWYELRVIARSVEGIESAPSAIEQFQMVDDVTAPPTPTAPDVTTWLRTVTVRWDGMGLSPSDVELEMPADFNMVYVWQGTAPDMATKTLVGTFTREVPMWQSNTMPAGTTVWYALSAVDWSGNESALSDSVSVTPVANVDLDEITDVIDGAMLGANSVTYISLLASEQMWTRVLGAHKILAGEINVNSLTADTAFIGSLRTGILIANSVDTTILKADAITAKHTITGAVFQTSASINTGIKIDPTNGFRAWDSGGNPRVVINNSGATFTGTVTSGFGSAKAVLDDSVYQGRPGIRLVTGSSYWAEPFITSYDNTHSVPSNRGALFASAAWPGSGGDPGRMILSPGGEFDIGGYNGGIATFPDGEGLFDTRSGGTMYLGATASYIQGSSGTSVMQVESNGTAVISATSGTTIYGGLNVSGSKNFVMDHPLYEGMELLHASTESPVSGVEYWGCMTLDAAGTATVQLPDYFGALIKTDSECVAAYGNGSMVSWTGINDNQFIVSGEPDTQFSWLVKAERIDGDFEVERTKVEPSLPNHTRGPNGSE